MALNGHRALVIAVAAAFLAGALPDVTAFVWPFVIGTYGESMGVARGTADATAAFRMIFPAIGGAMVVALVPVVGGWVALLRATRRDRDAPAHVRNVAAAGTGVAALAWTLAVVAATDWLTGIDHAVTSPARSLVALLLAGLAAVALFRSPAGRSAAIGAVGLFVLSEIVMLVPSTVFDEPASYRSGSDAMVAGYVFLGISMLARFAGWVALGVALWRARTTSGALW